ncbi:MAG: tyrosine-protein phosphatase [Flavobacteriaceae bacterium]|jgi:protein-tyrosine phosphatase|nr:tyrosine-protein phosphatase [Flavobacteriaceae bacterium]
MDPQKAVNEKEIDTSNRLSNSSFKQKNSSCILQGQTNFRDLGGYPTIDNRMVKPGMVFRSGHLNKINTDDVTKLQMLSLHTIVDFRTPQERIEYPNILPSNLKQEVHLPINPGNWNEQEVGQMIYEGDVEKTSKFLLDINEQFILYNQEEYKAFFEVLLQDNEAPIMFNCTAGKDRTGIASALFLASLDVSLDAIFEDYLLTNTRVSSLVEQVKQRYNLSEDNQLKALHNILTVDIKYIEKAFETIYLYYGDIQKYLENQLEVDIDKMKKKYLY